MIWHFVEVWLLVLLMFVVGCLAGAWLYGFIAESRLATAQGAVADSVGDVMDRLKARLGVAPAWRRAHLRSIERHAPAGVFDGAGGADEPRTRDDAPAAELPDAPARRALHRRLAGIESEDDEAGDGFPDSEPETLVQPPPPEPKNDIVPTRPAGLSAPRGGAPDNLQRIKGIGKRNEALLNSLGIFHFGQVAAWTPGEVRWIGQYLAFPERIERDDWVGQATVIAMGSDTGFEKSSERRRRRRQQQREFKTRMALAGEAGPEVPEPEDEGAGRDEGEVGEPDESDADGDNDGPFQEPLTDEPIDAEFHDADPIDEDGGEPRD